jgi:hypothetical protein
MKSMIVGDYEETVLPTVELYRAAEIAGVSLTIDAGQAGSTARLIEALAQLLDNERALKREQFLVIKTGAICVMSMVLFALFILLF